MKVPIVCGKGHMASAEVKHIYIKNSLSPALEHVVVPFWHGRVGKCCTVFFSFLCRSNIISDKQNFLKYWKAVTEQHQNMFYFVLFHSYNHCYLPNSNIVSLCEENITVKMILIYFPTIIYTALWMYHPVPEKPFKPALEHVVLGYLCGKVGNCFKIVGNISSWTSWGMYGDMFQPQHENMVAMVDQ